MQEHHTDVERLLEHRGWVERLARSLVADANTADDIAQTAWVAALKHPPLHAENLRAWLAALVRNTARTMRRTDSRRAHREAGTVEARHAGAASEALERAEMARELVSAVLGLREPYRTVLVLAYFEGLSPGAIAEKLGVPTSTVRTQTQRGLALVRAELERKHDDLFPSLLVLARRPGVSLAGATIMTVKWKVSLAALAIAALALWVWQSSSVTPTERSSAAEPAALVGLSPSKPAVANEELNARSPAPGSSRSAGSATAGFDPAVHVEVVWAKDGAPAAGVGVLMTWSHIGRHYKRRATTDPDGRCELQRPDAKLVGVQTDRGGNGFIKLEPGQPASVRVEIPPGVRVRGLVVDPTLAPIAGADIYARYSNNEDESLVAQSDGEGRFEVTTLAVRQAVTARKSGWSPSFARELRGEPDGSEDVKLMLRGRGGAVSGRVLGPKLEPLTGAEIFIRGPSQTAHLPDGARGSVAPPRRLVSGPAGEFETDDLSLGENSVVVVAAGFANGSATVLVTAETRASVEVQLSAGASLHGTLRDPEGLPMAATRVDIARPGEAQFSLVRTEADGSFRFAQLPAGEHRIEIDGGSRGHMLTTLALVDGEDREWNPVLDRGLAIAGRLVDEDGKPLEGWLVWTQSTKDRFTSEEFAQSINMPTHWGRSTTDAEGRFLLSNCLPWEAQLEVRRPREPGSHPVLVVDEIEPGTRDIVLRVATRAPVAFLRGTIVDEDGVPIGGAGVSVGQREIHSYGSIVGGKSTPGTGTFSVGPLPKGAYRVEIRAPGFADMTPSQDIDIVDGDVDLGTVRLMAPGSVCVVLSREGGGTIENVHVSVRERDGGDETDLGLFGDRARTERLRPGRYYLTVRFRGRELATRLEFTVEKGKEVMLEYTLPR